MLNRILELMREKNINKNQLAQQCNLIKSTIYNVLASEENLQKAKLETIKLIAKALDTTLDYLMYGNENLKSRDSLVAISDSPKQNNPNQVTLIARGGFTDQYELTDEEVQALKTILAGMKKK